MKCEQAHTLLIESRLDPELESHVTGCAECRQFARALDMIRVPPAVPQLPAWFHDRVLRQSADLLRDGAGGRVRVQTQKAGTLHLAIRSAGFAGLTLALVVGVYLVGLKVWLVQEPPALLNELIITILIVQNLLALLSSPVLLLQFFRPVRRQQLL